MVDILTIFVLSLLSFTLANQVHNTFTMVMMGFVMFLSVVRIGLGIVAGEKW